MLLLGSAALAARCTARRRNRRCRRRSSIRPRRKSRRAVAQTALAAGARDADAAATGTGHPAAGGQNALVLPPEAVKAGSTRFLNGKWRATVALKDPITGKRPGLQYRLNGGKGNAIIAYGDGVSCRVAVEAGLMQSGNLVINSRTKARCSDGSRYQIPEIVCRRAKPARRSAPAATMRTPPIP